MKKLITAALFASTIFAAPAMAQTADGVGTFTMSAPVATYCVFGQTGNSVTASTNATGSGSTGEGYAGADVGIQFDLQSATDTGKAASLTFTIPTVVCNTPFTLSTNSTNGGLKNAATTTDTDFTSLLTYGLEMSVDGLGSGVRSIGAGSATLATVPEARAGIGRVAINVPATAKLLLQGSYTDTLVVTMAPSVGGPSPL